MPHWREFLDADMRPGRYLPWKEVARETGLSRTTAWRLQKRGDFPAPYALSPGRVAYREDEVDAWRRSRDHSAARPAPPPSPPRVGAVPSPALGTPTPVCATPSRTSSVGVVDGSAPKGATAGPRPARRARRSQHAQAIAQQMRFDF